MGQNHMPVGHIMGPSQIFVLTIGTSLCGHHRRAVVATGCVMDTSQVFALVMGTKRAKPRLRGYHRRAAVAVSHVMSPPQVFVSTFVPSPVAFYLHGFPTSQQWALMEPNHVPMATTEGPQSHWPHHGSSPTLYFHNEHQWGQITSPWPPWKGCSSHWPHHGSYLSLYVDDGCRQGQPTGTWPSQNSCNNH